MSKKVVYWLLRAIRVEDNAALNYAIDLAIKQKAILEINFFIWPLFSTANTRNMHFLLSGVVEMAQKCAELNIELQIKESSPVDYFKKAIIEQNIIAIVNEQHVLKEVLSIQNQVRNICKENNIMLDLMNTAVIVPVDEASDKLEYAAFTIRKKLHSKYKEHAQLLPYPKALHQEVKNHAQYYDLDEWLSKHKHIQKLSLSLLKPGEDAANECLDEFINNRLDNYHLRNQVDSNGQSYLSAYLHFGNISPKKVISKVLQTKHENADLFVEEAFIRRELAENYCHYNKDYDSLEGAWPWAISTLNDHLQDPREYVYNFEQFEQANTHDDVWNYCQKQVLKTGYLHSYLRMYWAKMVLYWTKHPQDAIDILIALNDTYMLDGRDPNGYTGILWSVAGVHDRPWFNKPITGLVRPMSKNGTLKKTKLKL